MFVKVLFSCENSSIVICPDKRLSALEYANNVLQLNEDSTNLRVFFDHLIDSVGMYVYVSFCTFEL